MTQFASIGKYRTWRTFDKFAKGWLGAVLLVGAVACEVGTATTEGNAGPTGPSNIRVHNNSSFAFQGVVANTVVYGDIAGGAVSEYKLHAEAYRITSVQLAVEGAPASLQPIDFTGEKRLGPGQFTYHVSATPNGKVFTLMLSATKDL